MLEAILMAFVGSAAAHAADIPNGIPRALAQERAARVSNLHYQLTYHLAPHAASTEATEQIRFLLRDGSAPLLLDFRDGSLIELHINGTALNAPIDHGHIVLPAASLQTGTNTVDGAFHGQHRDRGQGHHALRGSRRRPGVSVHALRPDGREHGLPLLRSAGSEGTLHAGDHCTRAWSVISNTAPQTTGDANNGLRITSFAETEPIPTYLFAFAAGPFVNVHPQAGMPNVWVRTSRAKAAETEVPAVQTTAAEGIRYLSNYFAQPFPFPKYEMVLIPGFAYGGMEHAGATFLREESVLFRTAPTANNRLNRQILVLHELTHQWFGDFTTMRWFDDLWLKEGFAQYMAYKTLAVLRPSDNIWQHFYQGIKPAAYGIDETQGTTPVYQAIPNLNDAKSAYGAIVYSKAPGVLRQLNYVIGDDAFRRGLQLYLAQHRYGNATWSDLIAAFQSASGRDLTTWADMWIRHRGMPRVDAAWSCDGSRLASLRLTQRPLFGGDEVWPIATEVALGYADGTVQTIRAELNTQSVDVPLGAAPPGCPAWIFANNNDHAYGMFLLDARSRGAVMRQIGSMPDLFRRTLLWGSLWDSVREVELDPATYVGLALDVLPHERDESLAASLLAHTEIAVHHYVSTHAQANLLARGASLAADRMMNDSDHDLRIVWFRSLAGFAAQPAGSAVMKELLRGQRTVPGVELRQQDRWSLVNALLAYGDPEADAFFAAEQKRDPSGDGLKYAWVAQAARPDPGHQAALLRRISAQPAAFRRLDSVQPRRI